jgi:hypothetical protein
MGEALSQPPGFGTSRAALNGMRTRTSGEKFGEPAG